MAEAAAVLHLFDACGIECEYMIVDRDTLKLMPVSDRILRKVAGETVGDVNCGELSWSNELVMHVIEVKTSEPAKQLSGLDAYFTRDCKLFNTIVSDLGGCLMPGAMHPTMDPSKEMRLWPHDSNEIYEAFNRIFSCKGHGWANLQSMHINLPFSGDEEFGRLHAAIRAVLPLIPGIAASSPVYEGRYSTFFDSRMEVYRTNSSKIPSITGAIVPEPVYTEAEYRDEILQRIYRDLASCDPEGILRDEWVNARGAIARFSRQAIEIRVIDSQECAGADLAVASAVIALVKLLAEGQFASVASVKGLKTAPLRDLFLRAIKAGEYARIDDSEYLRLFGSTKSSCTIGELWKEVVPVLSEVSTDFAYFRNEFEMILNHGTLATRLIKALGPELSPLRIRTIYAQLCGCLQENRMFIP